MTNKNDNRGFFSSGSAALRTAVAAFALVAPACAHKQQIVYVQPPDRGDCILPVLQDHKAAEPYKFYVSDACLAQKKRELEEQKREHTLNQAAEFAQLMADTGKSEETMPDGRKILKIDPAKVSAIFGMLGELSPEVRTGAMEALALKGYHIPRMAVVSSGRMYTTKPTGVLMPDGTPVMALVSRKLDQPDQDDLPSAKPAPPSTPAPKK